MPLEEYHNPNVNIHPSPVYMMQDVDHDHAHESTHKDQAEHTLKTAGIQSIITAFFFFDYEINGIIEDIKENQKLVITISEDVKKNILCAISSFPTLQTQMTLLHGMERLRHQITEACKHLGSCPTEAEFFTEGALLDLEAKISRANGNGWGFGLSQIDGKRQSVYEGYMSSQMTAEARKKKPGNTNASQ